MRFLHISDLHVGRRLNGVSLYEEQKHILCQIVQIAREESCDAVLIAGDVYDKSNPSAEAMELYGELIASLLKIPVRVYIVSGNHDSSERVAYLSPVLQQNGVFIARPYNGEAEFFDESDEYGKIRVHLLPFIKPIHLRGIFEMQTPDSYDEALSLAIRSMQIDPDARNLLVCHQFVTGGVTSESEEASVGGLDWVSAEHFAPFDYVALGHLHRRQSIKKPTVHYAGSPYPYSFSESDDDKSVTVVDCKERGRTELRFVPLHLLHKLVKVRGSFADLVKAPVCEDYVSVELTDAMLPADAAARLSSVFPRLMQLSLVNRKQIFAEAEVCYDRQKKSDMELFGEFFALQNGREFEDDERALVLKLLNEAKEEQNAAD